MINDHTERSWWQVRRIRYNIGLLVAGFLAFICYVVIFSIYIESIPGAEITVFTIVFQGILYLLAMGVANVFYFLGPLGERLVLPSQLEAYRRISYRVGFWLSVALPFSVPLLLFVHYA